jgi:3alpha(or 20beta)-hydroxysteroid dehydrogenase
VSGAPRLAGKVAIITGGARGQGAAAAALFADEGATVVVADVLEEDGTKTAATCGGEFERLDVTDPESWRGVVARTMDRCGHVDVLLNNAGILRAGTVETTTLEEYVQVVMVNQVGCFLGMKSVTPAMAASGGGSIVNTSSIAGLRGQPGVFAYGASKWAVHGMTRSAAIELAHHRIRVNSVHPGAIDTPMVREVAAPRTDRSSYFDGLPVPRIGEADEVAKLLLYLASDDSAYVTGAQFVIDGGASVAGSTYRGVAD